ncbi:MAG: hypothetical protein A2252_00205 [Elusimicrobia bacterium RIFOXYA2_FULL_39_19]|nr:MAG: hypothetical protein A2252_00205 [Elusimicrobia bacterium RIFOXYA2_FULL_39_19]
MKFVIKKALGKLSFYDNTKMEFNSLEDLVRIAYEENDKHTNRALEVQGVDEKGNIYKIWFDFSNLVVQKQNMSEEDLTKIRSQKQIGQTLIDTGIITFEQLETALEEQRKGKFKEKTGEILIRLGFCTAEQILYGLAKQIGISVKVNKE